MVSPFLLLACLSIVLCLAITMLSFIPTPLCSSAEPFFVAVHCLLFLFRTVRSSITPKQASAITQVPHSD